MRFIPFAAALGLMALPAFAQTSPPPSAAAPATRTASAAAPAIHHRLTMEERFTKANTSHDGHLTLAQAKTGYPTVARHFVEIDTPKKGYVTADQIRAWEKAERERHHAGQSTPAAQVKG